MTQKNTINIDELMETAKKSTNEESYLLLHKTQVYRIGAGARSTPTNSVFFIEVIVNLSNESKKVDLLQLENILRFLRMLQKRKYSLTYEDNNYVQAETTRTGKDLNEEYLYIKALLKTQLG